MGASAPNAQMDIKDPGFAQVDVKLVEILRGKTTRKLSNPILLESPSSFLLTLQVSGIVQYKSKQFSKSTDFWNVLFDRQQRVNVVFGEMYMSYAHTFGNWY